MPARCVSIGRPRRTPLVCAAFFLFALLPAQRGCPKPEPPPVPPPPEPAARATAAVIIEESKQRQASVTALILDKPLQEYLAARGEKLQIIDQHAVDPSGAFPADWQSLLKDALAKGLPYLAVIACDGRRLFEDAAIPDPETLLNLLITTELERCPIPSVASARLLPRPIFTRLATLHTAGPWRPFRDQRDQGRSSPRLPRSCLLFRSTSGRCDR